MSYWLKLFTEIIDDPKLAEIPEWAKWCFVEFLCLAKENDKGGELQPVTKMAWRLRKTAKQVEAALRTLKEVGVVHSTGATWIVTNFAKRQAPSESAERVRRFREKQKQEKKDIPVTVTSYGNITPLSSSSSINSDSDSFDSFTPSETANAVNSFGNNGQARMCERLYQQVTGQICIPSSQEIAANKSLQAILDYCQGDLEKAVGVSKPVYQRWCSTPGKTGRNYSKLNTNWLEKVLETLAPDVETVDTVHLSKLDRVKQEMERIDKALT